MIYPSTYYYHFLGHHSVLFFFFCGGSRGLRFHLQPIPIHPGLQTNEALWQKSSQTQWMLLGSVDVEEVDSSIMVCLHVFETKNNFIYMTKILLLLIKLVCDTT